MKIGGLQKTTLIDYLGKISSTVFLIGCNFRCPFCYSPELVLPEKIKKQIGISEKDFFTFLKEKKGLLEAVTICGGEPTTNKDLPDFIKKIKELGYVVKIDTNGSNPLMLKDLIKKKLIDYVAMDIKAPIENQKYDRATGVKVNLKNIEESVRILKQNKVDFEFRSTIVPGIHTKEDVIKIAKWIEGPKVKFYLQNFNTTKPLLDPSLQKIKPYSKEYLLEIQKEILSFFEFCKIR